MFQPCKVYLIKTCNCNYGSVLNKYRLEKLNILAWYWQNMEADIFALLVNCPLFESPENQPSK